MPVLQLPVKLSVAATLIAAVGLVMFIIFPHNDAPLHPQLIWSTGLVIGAAAPVFALINHQNQQGQLYFGVIANAFFLGTLFFALSDGAVPPN